MIATGQKKLPAGWKWVKLGEVANTIRGVTFDKNSSSNSYVKGWIPILRAGNISTTLITDKDLIWVLPELVSPDQLLVSSDIAICMSSGSPKIVGKTATLNNDWIGSVGAFCAIIRPREKPMGNFLSHWFKSEGYFSWRNSQAIGTNIQNLRLKKILEIPIPLPPLEEQKRIADILNKAEEIKKLREEADKKTEELIPAIFNEMFEGNHKPINGRISDLCIQQRVSVKKDSLQSKELIYLGMENIESETGSIIDVQPQTKTNVKSNTFYFNANHVLYGKLRPYLNKVAVADFEGQCSTEIIPLLPKEASREYLVNLLRSKKIVDFVNASSFGSRMPRTNMNNLLSIPISIPTLCEQKEFVQRINKIRNFQNTQKLTNEKIEELKSSLLQRAFRGEL